MFIRSNPSTVIRRSPSLYTKEAKRKGLTSFVTITPGPRAEVSYAWQDPNIEWSGYSVTEIVPNLEDNNRPARMTEDGKIYYR